MFRIKKVSLWKIYEFFQNSRNISSEYACILRKRFCGKYVYHKQSLSSEILQQSLQNDNMVTSKSNVNAVINETASSCLTPETFQNPIQTENRKPITENLEDLQKHQKRIEKIEEEIKEKLEEKQAAEERVEKNRKS